MKLFRLSTLCALTLAGMTGTLLFRTAQSVQEAEATLGDLRLAVAQEEESLRVLRAEWDYLNRPDRLEALVKSHLDLVPPAAPPKKPSPGTHPAVEREAATRPAMPVLPAGGPPPDSGALKKIIEDSAAQKSFDDLLQDISPAAGGVP